MFEAGKEKRRAVLLSNIALEGLYLRSFPNASSPAYKISLWAYAYGSGKRNGTRRSRLSWRLNSRSSEVSGAWYCLRSLPT